MREGMIKKFAFAPIIKQSINWLAIVDFRIKHKIFASIQFTFTLLNNVKDEIVILSLRFDLFPMSLIDQRLLFFPIKPRFRTQLLP